jgi:hypothetical protein
MRNRKFVHTFNLSVIYEDLRRRLRSRLLCFIVICGLPFCHRYTYKNSAKHARFVCPRCPLPMPPSLSNVSLPHTLGEGCHFATPDASISCLDPDSPLCSFLRRQKRYVVPTDALCRSAAADGKKLRRLWRHRCRRSSTYLRHPNRTTAGQASRICCP